MDEQTLQTYESSAINLAHKFQGIGSRVDDINRASKLCSKTGLSVLELGCGDGRDASKILKLTTNYLGIDASKEFIKLASSRLGEKYFLIADILTFEPNQNYDIIFAFASLLHMNKTNLRKVLRKYSKYLNSNGVFYISLKRDDYSKKIQSDQFGKRTFYYYHPIDVNQCAPKDLKQIYLDFQTIGKTEWFTIAFKK